MVTAPTVVAAGLVEHVSGAPVPLMLHVTPPPVLVGAVPEVPVTAAVKVIVELRAPPPELVRRTLGVTFAMTTDVGAVATSAV